jgi:hypothetical protein
MGSVYVREGAVWGSSYGEIAGAKHITVFGK